MEGGTFALLVGTIQQFLWGNWGRSQIPSVRMDDNLAQDLNCVPLRYSSRGLSPNQCFINAGWNNINLRLPVPTFLHIS